MSPKTPTLTTAGSGLAMIVLSLDLLLCFLLLSPATCYYLRSSSSVFHGQPIRHHDVPSTSSRYVYPVNQGVANLHMRKQKASDRRTRRLQRGDVLAIDASGVVTQSPMQGKVWRHKQTHSMQDPLTTKAGGRGRSRKRSALYNSLSLYHNKFLSLLTEEYRLEEEEVLSRIKASLDDPLGYEAAGFALFDLYPERRGNLYSDEVYRLVKAFDATTTFPESASLLDTTATTNQEENAKGDSKTTSSKQRSGLPPNHKFSANDVIMLTLQPQGSGDFFNPASLPTNGVSIEARVLNVGPTYVDVAVSSGSFEAAFGPAPNNYIIQQQPQSRKGATTTTTTRGDSKMRLRADRFFSNIPYQRMVTALSQLTAIPDRQQATTETASDNNSNSSNKSDNDSNPHARICMDDLLRDVILTTHAYSDPFSSYYGDNDFCDLNYLSSSLARPPMASSQQLAKRALSYIRSNTQQIFENFNEPQLTVINAALTRRLTLIQGPPGTGKTSVASAIGFGFALQCRSLSPSGNAKVLACACSNVGADNLADRLLKLGLKVVRIGRPSAVSESLWDYTLDAFIDRDPDAQSALKRAARATAALQANRKASQSSGNGKKSAPSINEDVSRDLATAAVKASIQACNVAATRALREADVIVSTSTGASDPRLLASCGISNDDANDTVEANGRVRSTAKSTNKMGGPQSTSDRSSTAPDGLPPLSCPFVILDESCQSVEPASLIPISSTNSCRSLVLLGDPCQLPPTVRSGDVDSPLSVSLMSRLAATLPHPSGGSQQSRDKNFNTEYLDSLPIKQARSLFLFLRSENERDEESYRKRYNGANLLSIQYRMHPSISALPSAMFYDSLLATPAFLASARQFPKVFSKSMPCDDKELCVRLVDVGGRSNERQGVLKGYSKAMVGSKSVFFSEKEQTSYWNEEEARYVVRLVQEAVAAAGDPSSPRNIGVVTPYRSQVDLIKKMLAENKELMSTMKIHSIELEVKTVDGYQGRERDLIIFSAVRSNRKGSIGFLKDWRRLNVALTRARSGLIVVGDLDTLAESDRHWAALVKWCNEVNCVVFNSK